MLVKGVLVTQKSRMSADMVLAKIVPNYDSPQDEYWSNPTFVKFTADNSDDDIHNPESLLTAVLS